MGIIACLWECAENYKKEKLQKKQSAVWGYLTQVFCVVGAYVPPQSKLNSEELDKQLKQEANVRKQKEQALKEQRLKEQKEKKRIERNRAAYNRERKYIYWCNAYEQGNYVSIRSEKFKSKDKKYHYYW